MGNFVFMINYDVNLAKIMFSRLSDSGSAGGRELSQNGAK